MQNLRETGRSAARSVVTDEISAAMVMVESKLTRTNFTRLIRQNFSERDSEPTFDLATIRPEQAVPLRCFGRSAIK
jgi:hypothetical protein